MIATFLLAVLASSVLPCSFAAIICSSCASLEELYNSKIVIHMPSNLTEQYNIPSKEVRQDFEEIVSDMLYNPTSCEHIDLRSLTDFYDIGTFFDANHGTTYCVLLTTSIQYPWGTVIINANTDLAPRDLSIDCVHPIFDPFTAPLSLAVFQRTMARSLILSGSHRFANAQLLQHCDGHGHVSDAAHSDWNCILSATKAVYKYYEESHQDYTAIQFHAMAETSCPGVDVFFSYGVKTPPLQGEKLDLLRQELYKIWPARMSTRTSDANSPMVFTAPGEDGPYCRMRGTLNLQGRYINGVPEDAVCTQKATSHTGKFIHIETKYWMREVDLATHVRWSNAILNAYAQFPTATPPPPPESRPMDKEQHNAWRLIVGLLIVLMIIYRISFVVVGRQRVIRVYSMLTRFEDKRGH